MNQMTTKTGKTENSFVKFLKPFLAIKAFHLKVTFGILMSAALITGCGDGRSPENETSSSTLLSGRFVDSPVEGLEYETETRSGMTDAEGTFMYMAGETVTFYVGDVMLGGAVAQPVMTPIELVEGAMDETNPIVTNIARFLQTFDMDMNPNNGITITQTMANALTGHWLNFDTGMDAFENSLEIQSIMQTINMMDSSGAVHELVSIEDAQDHLANTMGGMMDSDHSTDNSDIPKTGGGMMH